MGLTITPTDLAIASYIVSVAICIEMFASETSRIPKSNVLRLIIVLPIVNSIIVLAFAISILVAILMTEE